MVVVRVKYLLWLMDRVGVSEETIEFSGSRLSGLVREIKRKYRVFDKYLPGIGAMDSKVSVLVNGVSVSKDLELVDGDEAVFIPLVPGG